MPKDKIIKLAVAVALLAVAAAVLLWQFWPSTGASDPQENAYYYDLSTGQTFVGPTGPAVAAGGARGGANSPRAHVFNCGTCGDGQDFVGYIELLDVPGSPTGPVNPRSPRVRPVAQAMVASPDTRPRWVPATSEEGKEVIAAALNRCGEGKQPKVCTPQ